MVDITFATADQREEVEAFMHTAFPRAKWGADGWTRLLANRWGGARGAPTPMDVNGQKQAQNRRRINQSRGRIHATRRGEISHRKLPKLEFCHVCFPKAFAPQLVAPRCSDIDTASVCIGVAARTHQ